MKIDKMEEITAIVYMNHCIDNFLEELSDCYDVHGWKTISKKKYLKMVKSRIIQGLEDLEEDWEDS